ncbi:MAG: hypothetical protein BWY95_01858 [Bacteroidetes bacterium ADurb.BinA104]|nr:MAG: hypothetical protein BWY95_01858 [Bacteroidetes bacterium ADurb.BinA104]
MVKHADIIGLVPCKNDGKAIDGRRQIHWCCRRSDNRSAAGQSQINRNSIFWVASMADAKRIGIGAVIERIKSIIGCYGQPCINI